MGGCVIFQILSLLNNFINFEVAKILLADVLASNVTQKR